MPLGYSQDLPSTATLTLDGLIAGDYVVRVIVEDKDGAKDQAEASLHVEPEIDYPPTANAGTSFLRMILLPRPLHVVSF